MKQFRKLKAARLLILTLMMFASFMFGMMVYAYGGDSKVEAAGHDVLSQTNIVKKVVVARGDTLWGIASEYAATNKDVRDYIHEIKRLNGLKNSVLHDGQQLILP